MASEPACATSSARCCSRGRTDRSAHQRRIFERFYRADASRHGSALGSGLGLAIVRSTMELHGGRAEVQSAAGERTVFSLHFPGPLSQNNIAVAARSR
jgi:two-component system heavy metal sensor histidine kinase CusS